MRLLLLLAFILPCVSFPALRAAGAESEIRTVLEIQVHAWNRGDIPTFVNTYAAECIFVGKEIARGRAQLLARYQRTYPTPAAMGHLSFRALEVRLLEASAAVVTGEWHIERDSGNIGGLFSLVFQRKAGKWQIVLDHTS